MKKIIFITLVIFVFVSCRDEKSITENTEDIQSIQSYMSNNPDLFLSDNLIACAASSVSELLDSTTSHNVSIILLPINSATGFKYFEMNNDFSPKEDFANYFEKDIKSLPLFNGFLRQFPQNTFLSDYWSRVTFITDDSLHICSAIRIKQNSKPTVVTDDIINISFTDPNKPLFSWDTDTDEDNFIYFQVISDDEDNVISATYTYEKYFQFYDLSNVVLNVYDVSPPPELKTAGRYNFTLMGVSKDNWVNLIAEQSFSTLIN
ncbi:MAG: hypothetical protein GY936_08860 [Ignavibacteriae bacterium]|nr:hypothetical protein [Ignavibacteriota bacterium]